MTSSLTSFFKDLTLEKTADLLVRFLLGFLPFNVIITVFFQYKLGLGIAAVFKELILVALFLILAAIYYKRRIKPVFDSLDIAAAIYVAIMLIVTLANGAGLGSYVYGGRYDFEFLFTLILFKHLSPLLPEKFSRYLRIAVISATWALVIGTLVRFVFKEAILIHLGFSGDLSNWKFAGAPPIYHGIEGANVRRFQGIFDGPNPAAYFILVYMGIIAHYVRAKKQFFFLLSLWAVVLIILLFYTYSRSSIIGFVAALIFALVASFHVIWKKHKKSILIAIPILAILSLAFYAKFENTFGRIVLREGSSKGHFSRVITGLNRFREQPLGQGLATSGPAYRFVIRPEANEDMSVGDNKKQEDFYIPESWYVQQLVEGGILGFLAFIAVMWFTFVRLLKKSLPIACAFVGLGAMLLFLHTLESAFISIFFFAIIGLLIGNNGDKKVTL